MCVEWDPIKEANILPDTWKFLYCFEVWHRRCIPLDIFSAAVGSAEYSNNASTSTRRKSWLPPYLSPLKSNKYETYSEDVSN